MTEFRSRTKSPGARGARRAAPAQAPEQAPERPEPQSGDAVVRRTRDGWRVGTDDVPDLTSAMALADLISAELAAPDDMPQPPPSAVPVPVPADAAAAVRKGGRSGSSKETAGSETSRLRATIAQLEHALTARIRVEQAIGVLAERHRIQPRQAFEQLRSAARSRGKRVIDIASDVVASASNPLLQLPDELSRPRSGGRHGRPGRQAHGILGSE